MSLRFLIRFQRADTIAERYVEWILVQCRQKAGKLYVDEANRRVVSFLSVWLETSLSGMISQVHLFAYISDVVVLAPYRPTPRHWRSAA
jgi:hypothetical protein